MHVLIAILAVLVLLLRTGGAMSTLGHGIEQRRPLQCHGLVLVLA